MKVLRAIGRFFARIGRWIADTAWVQPLLIVGGIFAIIFSIPYLVDWVGTWFEKGSSAEVYYKKYKASWNGVESDSANSNVDKLFKYLMDPDSPENAATKKKYGEKFFISFVIEDCPDCESNYYGLKTAQSNWGKAGSSFDFETVEVRDEEAEAFKLVSIYVDEANTAGKLFFSNYISGNENTCRYNEIFEEASQLDSPYVTNIGGGDDYYNCMYSTENDFTTPALMLIDFSDTQPGYAREFGISEIIFKYEGRDGGTSNHDLARTIWDCWNHQGKFSSDWNK